MLDFDKLRSYRQTKPGIIKKRLEELNLKDSPVLTTDDWFGFIDYALLDYPISSKQVGETLKNLWTFYDQFDYLRFAAVCVYPNHLGEAISYLKNTKTAIAAVTGSFPSGQSNLKNKLLETRHAIDEGAQEIDYVYDIGNLIDEEYESVFEELSAVKDVCNTTKLKVIIESGNLPDLRSVRIATEIALNAGADYVKTSTGKTANNATLETAIVIMQGVKSYFEESGEKRGVKISGGVSSLKMAEQYLSMARQILGNDWLSPDFFRIGAGGMAAQLIMPLSE